MSCTQTLKINKRIPIKQFNIDSLPLQVTNSVRLLLNSNYKKETDTSFSLLSKTLAYPNIVNGNIMLSFKNNILFISTTGGDILKSYKYHIRKRYLAFKEVDKNWIIPFLYANRHLNKFRVYQTKEGASLLWCRYINEGMLLLFGAGNTHDLTFQLIK